MKIYDVEIKGIVPLLQSNPISVTDSDVKKTPGKPDYTKEAEQKLYRNTDGKIFVPSTWVEGTLRKASSLFKIPGRGKATYKDLVLSSIIVEPTEILIKPQKYEVDARTVVINRSRVMRYRPIFKEWTLNFKINVLEEQFSEDAVQQILVHAGGYKGIGDYRPKFGRFEVTQFKSIETS